MANKNIKLPVLITNNHVLDKERLKIGNKISIEYDDNDGLFIMSINENTKIYTNRIYDVTIIEMKEDSDKYNQLIFMDVDEDIFNSKGFLMEKFYKKKAYILQYAKPINFNVQKENNSNIIKKNKEELTKDKKYAIEEGKIIVNDDENIIHNIPTSPGAGGGPIISHNKFKVIGYHIGKKANSSSEYKGIGRLLKLPLLEFINQFYS